MEGGSELGTDIEIGYVYVPAGNSRHVRPSSASSSSSSVGVPLLRAVVSDVDAELGGSCRLSACRRALRPVLRPLLWSLAPGARDGLALRVLAGLPARPLPSSIPSELVLPLPALESGGGRLRDLDLLLSA